MRVTRDGSIIPGTEASGETFSIYTIVEADAGTTIRGQVRAQDSGGLWSLFVNSNPIEIDDTGVWQWNDGSNVGFNTDLILLEES